MRALVTGAGGFIGAQVAHALAAAGADVVVGDLLDAAALDRALDGCDAVFHLAAVYSFARADAALMLAVNVDGTRLLLERAARGPRRRIVHTCYGSRRWLSPNSCQR